MATMTMIEAIHQTLREEMTRDERVMLLGQDIGQLGGVFRATDGLQAEFGKDRVVDTPLAEAAIAGSALGLAAAGEIPVAELQFLGFTHQAFHQIGAQIARFRFRSKGRFNAQLVLRTPFGGNVRTPELHSDAFEALFTQTPGLKVALPATAHDAAGMLRTSIRDPDPVLFLEPLRGYRLVRDDVPEGDHTVPLGKARVAREGDDVTIVAWSAAVQVAERAAEKLAADGISAGVLDLRTLSPLDVETLASTVAATGRCVVVHEAPMTGGFAAEVIATLNDECFYDLEAPVARVTSPDTPYPLGPLEEQYIPDVERLARTVRSVMELEA